VKLRLKQPFDAGALFDFFAARALPGVEIVEGGCYRRTMSAGARSGIVSVEAAPSGKALILSLESLPPGALPAAAARARRLFDLDADPAAIAPVLAREPLLAPLVARRPGLRVPGAWDPFEVAVRAVLGQQISVAGARTIAGRLVALCGRRLPARRAAPGLTHLFPSARAVAAADLSRVGLPRARAAALRSFAGAVADGSFLLAAPRGLDDFEGRLTARPGFGPWTAHVVALRAFGERDAFPAGDLGLVRALERAGVSVKARDVAARAERWRPYRAYATLHLWASLADAKGGP
jgi:3-methyladenine DNA glycosylase/8-oxoguanine DNA glycosylase